MMAGAHMARRAQVTALVSRTRLCLVQFTKSGDENASKNTCALYGAEYVGYIQYRLPKTAPSGSAYQPGNTGLPDLTAPAVPAVGRSVLQPESVPTTTVGGRKSALVRFLPCAFQIMVTIFLIEVVPILKPAVL